MTPRHPPPQAAAGYMIHIDHLMPTLSWLSWFSYMRFSFSAALLVELKSTGQAYNQHDLAKRALSGPDHADWLKMVLMFLPEQVDGEEIARNYSYWPGTTLGGIGERSARARARPPPPIRSP